MRLIGSGLLITPFISSCFVVSNLALAGMPFLAGFYSKDLILEVSLFEELNILSLIFLFLATGLTVIYTFRLIYYVSLRRYVLRGRINLRDGSGVIIKSTLGLASFSIIFGACVSWLIMDSPEIFLPSYLKNLTLTTCVSGALIGFFISQSRLHDSLLKNKFHSIKV